MILEEGLLKKIHVIQPHIREHWADKPFFCVYAGDDYFEGYSVDIKGESKLVPGKLSSGARAWVETTAEVHLEVREPNPKYNDLWDSWKERKK